MLQKVELPRQVSSIQKRWAVVGLPISNVPPLATDASLVRSREGFGLTMLRRLPARSPQATHHRTAQIIPGLPRCCRIWALQSSWAQTYRPISRNVPRRSLTTFPPSPPRVCVAKLVLRQDQAFKSRSTLSDSGSSAGKVPTG
jgi:hypothetical protein